MNDVSISVVIPTYNRQELLRYSLQALCQQTVPRTQFEVIVVDDGGSDGSAAIVQEFANQLNVKYFWQEDRGFRVSKARNIGTAIACGSYLLYIDAGVLLASTTLARHLHKHAASSCAQVILGYVYGFETAQQVVEPVIAQLNPAKVDHSIALLHQHQAFDIRQRQYQELGDNISNWPAPFDILWGCHFSAERNEVLKAGLFDESFVSWGGEDVDLGVRLFLNQNQFQLDRRATSLHWPHKKEVLDHRAESAQAAQKIHQKYRLWSTGFYSHPSNDEKFSLNKMIKLYANGSDHCA